MLRRPNSLRPPEQTSMSAEPRSFQPFALTVCSALMYCIGTYRSVTGGHRMTPSPMTDAARRVARDTCTSGEANRIPLGCNNGVIWIVDTAPV